MLYVPLREESAMMYEDLGASLDFKKKIKGKKKEGGTLAMLTF